MNQIEKKIWKITRVQTGSSLTRVEATVNGEPLRYFKYWGDKGFDYGIREDGINDLALSIMCSYFGEDPQDTEELERSAGFALQMVFKWEVLRQKMVYNRIITEEDIQKWVLKEEDPEKFIISVPQNDKPVQIETPKALRIR